MNYGVWNNKGGVGKTFLSYTLALEYAHKHPNSKVILVDMCPQANLSEIILGGNGTGCQNLNNILSANQRKTIGGYFDERIASPHKITGNETSYLIEANSHNEQMPDNVYLVCGDPSLELQAQVISQIGSQTLPLETWKNVRSWLKDLVTSCKSKLGKDVFVFIDCNPSFSAYTELAMIASERLIVPCSCDGSSARAIKNIESLLYDRSNPLYGDKGFANMCHRFGLPLPLIHSVILNRSTQYNKEASKAFGAMFTAIKGVAETFYRKDPQAFVSGGPEFDEMPDSHSVAIVSSHLGKPLYNIKPGKYDVHDTQPQVNSEPLERYKTAIGRLCDTL